MEFPVCEDLQDRLGFSGIPSEHVADILPQYKPLILKAADRADGENAWPDIVQQLTDGYWQMWVTPQSVMVTAIREEGQFNVCVVIYMAGVLKDVRECYPGLVEWAKSMGCKRLHIEGRKGWGRVLEDFGAKLKYHVYSIDLED